MDQEEQARRPVAQLGAAALKRSSPPRERGWVGLVVILIALVIVALMAQKALKSYGLVPDGEQTAGAGNRLPPAASPAGSDATTAPVTPGNALQRARGLEQQVKRGAEEQEKRINEQTQ